ncbi:MAG TPA: hypothetical protein VGI27_01875 [Solirubrobacteraceae bacterium]
MTYGICEKCGRPVRAPEQPAFPVTGWELLRDGGGANAIRLRERIPDRVRHVTCLPHPNEDQTSLC